MLDSNIDQAHWLGGMHYGKSLREPINIIIIDKISMSTDEAKKRLIDSCTLAGYPSRRGHSGGYIAYIGHNLYSQLPEEKTHAFSNGPFEFKNNHGRIFGPHFYYGNYIFTGAFSREKIAPLAQIKHEFDSFNIARDDFAQNLDRKTSYKISGYISMNNFILKNPKITTADHDGIAILITLE
ncbi:MAG: hypothetical protein HQK78_09560, partial [Desulfobacterales bacterium]|nr:hypothetical protein [Desulfobacterales bacterium]